jgi:hypothetical protein
MLPKKIILLFCYLITPSLLNIATAFICACTPSALNTMHQRPETPGIMPHKKTHIETSYHPTKGSGLRHCTTAHTNLFEAAETDKDDGDEKTEETSLDNHEKPNPLPGAVASNNTSTASLENYNMAILPAAHAHEAPPGIAPINMNDLATRLKKVHEQRYRAQATPSPKTPEPSDQAEQSCCWCFPSSKPH